MPTILGPIARLQIQRSSLKIGEKPNRYYSPDPLLSVPQLRLTTDGAYGRAAGVESVDVHNLRHPNTKQEEDHRNGISVGFTGHYAEMQDRFGDHMTTGVAGENIIVDLSRRVTLAEVEAGLVVLDRATKREKARLLRVVVATPCKPFSGFALKGETVPPETLKQTLAFLDAGMRGYYCGFDGPGDVVVEVGDLVATA